MSYIDPDLLYGALTNLDTFITENSAAITAKGLNSNLLTGNLTTIQTDLTGKKSIRDTQKTALAVAQQDFVTSAATNYTAFSNLIDVVAGTMGKETPAGKQVLAYRTHVTGGSHHAKPVVTPPAPPQPNKTA